MNFAELRFWLYLAIILGAVLIVLPLFQKAVKSDDLAMSRDSCTTDLKILVALQCI